MGSIDSPVISESKVLEGIGFLGGSGSVGPDSIHPLFIMSCASALAKPLCDGFNESLALGLFPTTCKLSYIIPIFKSGDRHSMKSYRPIPVLNVIP